MGVLITPKNIYNLQAKIASLSGFKDPDQFWTRPLDQYQPPEQPPPPQVQVAQINAQVEQQKLQAQQQADEQRAQRDHQLRMQELAAKAETSRQENERALILQRSNDERQMLLDKYKAEQEERLALLEDARERDRMRLDADLKREIEFAKIAARERSEAAKRARPRRNPPPKSVAGSPWPSAPWG